MCGPQNDNSGDWVVAHNILTDVCGTYLLYCTWYSGSVHLRLLSHFGSLPWSNKPFARVGSEIYLWNSLDKLMSVFTVEVWISICESYADVPYSYTVVINIKSNRLSVASKPSKFLVIQHHDQLLCYMCVPILMINIVQSQRIISLYRHTYFPI